MPWAAFYLCVASREAAFCGPCAEGPWYCAVGDGPPWGEAACDQCSSCEGRRARPRPPRTSAKPTKEPQQTHTYTESRAYLHLPACFTNQLIFLRQATCKGSAYQSALFDPTVHHHPKHLVHMNLLRRPLFTVTQREPFWSPKPQKADSPDVRGKPARHLRTRDRNVVRMEKRQHRTQTMHFGFPKSGEIGSKLSEANTCRALSKCSPVSTSGPVRTGRRLALTRHRHRITGAPAWEGRQRRRPV